MLKNVLRKTGAKRRLIGCGGQDVQFNSATATSLRISTRTRQAVKVPLFRAFDERRDVDVAPLVGPALHLGAKEERRAYVPPSLQSAHAPDGFLQDYSIDDNHCTADSVCVSTRWLSGLSRPRESRIISSAYRL